MTEDMLLEKAMEIAEDDGYAKAFEWTNENRAELPAGDHPQVYYFLMCFACGSGNSEMALELFDEAVTEKGYWFRDEAIDDEDLEPLFENEKFTALRAECKRRFDLAQSAAKPFCTFREKDKSCVLLAAHGNGQSAEDALSSWGQLENEYLQVEALQSDTVDSFGRFRWNYDDRNWRLIPEYAGKMPWESFERRMLAGFSAGCDMVLRTAALSDIVCEKIFLQSPWIPFFEENPELVAEKLTQKGIETHIFCGTDDEDCRDMAKALYELLMKKGAAATLEMQAGLRHQFPEKLDEAYKKYL